MVKSFVEKPAYELSNDHYWNSGIFVFKAKRYINEIKKFAPNLYDLCCASIRHFSTQEKLLYLKQQDFQGIEDMSIDYLVMEKAANIAMVESNCDWMDVGTWSAVLELSKKSDTQSIQHSLRENNSNELVSTKSTYKQQNILNKSLISFINKVSKIKAIRKEVRPWGFYSVILICENFLIKYLFINPLSCTSKQFHYYRDEYHIILSGVGYVILDDKVHAMVKNHVIEIPRNIPHRIENKSTNSPLEIVEFQTGEYLSDDDIVRLDDLYGRV
jgi:mannose-1-phosphate guanylyltransferase